ncbi:V-type H+-transporting ATPase 54 kD subunit [Rhodotorula toruloides]|uniref:V-type H+-transporting ATPase 54 kD subunit n=1 Tax=Rhodotorula toruloides TaxID=5286 RepID=A0A511KBH0_RHOTO|nr:V-type H+-transporting ATPase 54 kD subunit [Rhodotorula toruloides]
MRNDTLRFILVLFGYFVADRDKRIFFCFSCTTETPYLSLLKLTKYETEGQGVADQCLESALRVVKAREISWDAGEGDAKAPKVIKGFVQLLRAHPPPQLQYQLAFCFWLPLFDQTVAAQINARYNVVPLLLDLVKQAIKAKIVRIMVPTFRYLITKAPEQNLAAMLTVKILPWLQTLQGRKFGDEDIKEDVDFLVDELKRSFEGLTTWDEYKSELAMDS